MYKTMKDYKQMIEKYKITKLGFDTQARVLGISKENVKKYWNEHYFNKFKRIPRTEFSFKERPELTIQKNFLLWFCTLGLLGNEKKYYELVTDSDYLAFYITPTCLLIVPNGYLTDKGSIPMLFQAFVSKDNADLLIAFLFHDVECDLQRIPRFETDNLIYAIGTELGSSWLTKNLVYSTVRAGNRYGKPDRVVNGFNITNHNRELFKLSEDKLIKKGKMSVA